MFWAKEKRIKAIKGILLMLIAVSGFIFIFKRNILSGIYMLAFMHLISWEW